MFGFLESPSAASAAAKSPDIVVNNLNYTMDICFRRAFNIPTNIPLEEIKSFVQELSDCTDASGCTEMLLKNIPVVNIKDKKIILEVIVGTKYPKKALVVSEGTLAQGSFGIIQKFAMYTGTSRNPVSIIGKISIYKDKISSLDFLRETVVHVILQCSLKHFLHQRYLIIKKSIPEVRYDSMMEFPIPAIRSIVQTPNNNIMVLMEHVQTSLFDLLTKKTLNPGALEDIFVQITCQLYWLQRMFEFVHGDLHLGNVMVSKRRKAVSKRYYFEDSTTGDMLYIDQLSYYKIYIIDYGESCIKDLTTQSSVGRSGFFCSLKSASSPTTRCANQGFDMMLFLGNYIHYKNQHVRNPITFFNNPMLHTLLSSLINDVYQNELHWHELYNCFLLQSDIFTPKSLLKWMYNFGKSSNARPSNTRQSNTRPSNTRPSNTETSNTKPSNTIPSNTKPFQNEYYEKKYKDINKNNIKFDENKKIDCDTCYSFFVDYSGNKIEFDPKMVDKNIISKLWRQTSLFIHPDKNPNDTTGMVRKISACKDLLLKDCKLKELTYKSNQNFAESKKKTKKKNTTPAKEDETVVREPAQEEETVVREPTQEQETVVGEPKRKRNDKYAGTDDTKNAKAAKKYLDPLDIDLKNIISGLGNFNIRRGFIESPVYNTSKDLDDFLNNRPMSTSRPPISTNSYDAMSLNSTSMSLNSSPMSLNSSSMSFNSSPTSRHMSTT
jgi:hypothetical protein